MERISPSMTVSYEIPSMMGKLSYIAKIVESKMIKLIVYTV